MLKAELPQPGPGMVLLISQSVAIALSRNVPWGPIFVGWLFQEQPST